MKRKLKFYSFCLLLPGDSGCSPGCGPGAAASVQASPTEHRLKCQPTSTVKAAAETKAMKPAQLEAAQPQRRL